MRVVLSGTSNSILAKSLSYTLAHNPAVTHFTNQSYGASGSVALGDHLRQIDFAEYDFCIFDYCVNEDFLIFEKASTPDAAMNNLLAGIDAASRAGCQPIVVILPIANGAQNDRPLGARVRVLTQAGVPVFDGYPLTARLMAAADCSYEELFLDPMHIRREIGRFVGDAVIKHMKAAYDAGGPEVVQSDLTYQPLAFLPATALELQGRGGFETRASKLAEVTVLSAAPGARITLPFEGVMERPLEVVGLSLDAARTLGTLCDADTGDVMTEIKDWALFSTKRGFTLISLPCNAPLRVDADSVSLSYDSREIEGEHKPDPMMDISGFILRAVGQDREVQIARTAQMPVVLEEQVTDTELAELVAVLTTNPCGVTKEI